MPQELQIMAPPVELQLLNAVSSGITFEITLPGTR